MGETPATPAHGELAHGEPAHGEPARGEFAHGEPAHGEPEHLPPAAGDQSAHIHLHTYKTTAMGGFEVDTSPV